MKPASLGTFLAIAALAAFGSSCSRGDAIASTREQPLSENPIPTPPAPSAAPSMPEQAAGQTGTLPQLVFFINPNGAPCQIQDRILRDMAAELQPKVRVVYYRTTEAAHLDKFRQYGIRALPTLVLTDPAGKELRRTTPGVQGPDQVRRLIAL